MSTPRRAATLAPLFLVLLAGLAVAGTVVHDSVTAAKRAAGGAQTWFATGLTGNHSSTSATAVDRQFISGGDTYLRVKVRGSSGSGAATACIMVLAAGTDGVLDSIAGVQTVTLSAFSIGGNGYQPLAPIYFDLSSETSYDVRVIAVSAGTVDLEANTCGAASIAAE